MKKMINRENYNRKRREERADKVRAKRCIDCGAGGLPHLSSLRCPPCKIKHERAYQRNFYRAQRAELRELKAKAKKWED